MARVFLQPELTGSNWEIKIDCQTTWCTESSQGPKSVYEDDVGLDCDYLFDTCTTRSLLYVRAREYFCDEEEKRFIDPVDDRDDDIS